MTSIHRAWEWLGSRSAVRVVQVVVLVVTCTVIWLARQQSESVQCNTRYNTGSAAYDRARSDTAAQERAAGDELWRTLRDNPEGFRAAIDRYLETRRLADEARAKAPVLPPPADLCS